MWMFGCNPASCSAAVIDSRKTERAHNMPGRIRTWRALQKVAHLMNYATKSRLAIEIVAHDKIHYQSTHRVAPKNVSLSQIYVRQWAPSNRRRATYNKNWYFLILYPHAVCVDHTFQHDKTSVKNWTVLNTFHLYHFCELQSATQQWLTHSNTLSTGIPENPA